jgi:2-polyprenyl-6-methoxyphenol hydroxylase-like FAD-dependent oxidoreductase
MSVDPCPVLIIGAGPSGLFTACELARHGVQARLIERTLTPHRQARGTAIQPATLELLARGGVVDPFLREGVQVREVQVVGRGLVPLAADRIDGTDAVWPFQCCLPQWRTEEILAAHFARLGGRVERGVSLTAVAAQADGVLVDLSHSDGRVEHLAVRWLIDASGAHSLTRRSMQEPLEGDTYPDHYLVADGVTTSPVGPATVPVLLVDAAGPVLFAPLPQARRLVFIQLAADEQEEEVPEPSLERINALLIQRLGCDLRLHDLRWSSHFRVHRRIVPHLADGHRFLIGDAGHLSSPLGGEGLNAGLMDGADLAWKLALVMRGAATSDLLSTYVIERGLADRQVLAASDEQHRGVQSLLAKLTRPSPTATPPPSQAEQLAGRRRRSMLDVSYAGSPLIGSWGEDGLPAPSPQPGERWPQRCRLEGVRHQLLWFPPSGAGHQDPALADFARRWGNLVEVTDGTSLGLDPGQAGVEGSGAVLIRPDGHIGFRAIPAGAEALAAIDRHLERWFRPR